MCIRDSIQCEHFLNVTLQYFWKLRIEMQSVCVEKEAGGVADRQDEAGGVADRQDIVPDQ